MDDNIWSIFDLIFLAAGAYIIYAFILLKTTGELKTQILLNRDTDLKKCKDLEGYKKFIAPKLLTFGIVCIIYGAFGLVNTYVAELPLWLYIATMVLFFAALVWFALQSRKGTKEFW